MNTEDITSRRHSLAHLLAASVLNLYPGTKATIGPAIDNGFYYDFDFAESINNGTISEKDLSEIEKGMKDILHTWVSFDGTTTTPEEAKEIFDGNQYKIQLIDEIHARGEKITLYKSGDFTDLCRGGHTDNLSKIDPNSFRLSHTAGAYWGGSEKNKMLTRIYGLAFETASELEAYETQQAEAKKRDHKKLGKEMRLFTTSDLIGAGLPLIMPKGMVIRVALENYLWELHKSHGYEKVWTPHIAKEELYVVSGHAEKFGDELFRVSGKEDKFIMKPMNCPHHMQIFASESFSYRNMPVRYFEPATVYRDEKSGQLAGLTRVRAITQDDGHLFCRQEQIEKEVSVIIEIIKEFYTSFNLLNDYWVRLSVRGEEMDGYLGTSEAWEIAETALENAAIKNKLTYKRVSGEAAFYGPKLDFMFKDAIGREWQLATIQCDFNLPERFDLAFTNEKGLKERPVVIHRAISGSLERFMGVIIEHFAGNFPLWISPVQAKILTISDRHNDYAKKIFDLLKEKDIRVELDDNNESLGKKIRQVKTERIPYSLVVGDNEMNNNTVTLESRDKGKVGEVSLDELCTMLSSEISSKS